MTDDDQKVKSWYIKRQVLKRLTARESIAWLLLITALWGVSGYVNWLEYELRKIQISPTIVVVNEATSGVSALILVLFVRAWLDHFPLKLKEAGKSIAAHLLGSAIFSFGHVSLMIGFRYIVFTILGQNYNPAIPDGNYGTFKMFAYEYGKDFPVYWVFLMIIFLYRLYQDREHVTASMKAHAGTTTKLTETMGNIMVRSGNADVLVDLALVQCFQSASNYVRVFTTEKEYLIRGSLTELETTLGEGKFIRVHRSYIVNLAKVNKIITAESGNKLLELHDGRRIPVGRKYKNSLDKRTVPWTGFMEGSHQ